MQPTIPAEGFPSALELQEWKQVIEERRFVMLSYMQALALYLALGGYALKELLGENSLPIVIMTGIFFTCINGIALFAAARFKSMAVHASNREIALAAKFGVPPAHCLKWGHTSGVIVVVFFQVAVIAAVIFKARAH